MVCGSSRYDEPVVVPTEGDILALLAAADKLANSKNKRTNPTAALFK